MTLKEYDSVEDAVHHQLETLELTDTGQSLAQIALALARTLDTARDSTSGAMSQSVPGTSKELRETLKQIADTVEAGDTFLSGLLDN